MSRVTAAFDSARTAQRMAFMPFVTAGDPDLATTGEVLLALRDAQVDLVELGFPYSDPIADGPVIQASYTRALERHVTVHGIFDMMRGLRGQGLPPVLAMVSYAIIFRYGIEAFTADAQEAGFSGLIVPDLPADEAEELTRLAQGKGLDLIQLIAPTTTEERTKQILEASTGFLYCISVAGTTGVRKELPVELTQQLRSLRAQTKLPLAVGFGISGPDQVQGLAGVADGIIVGSAMVRRIAEAKTTADAAAAVKAFALEMMVAASRAKPSLGQ
jgi:tryptophan synthase alpha chain